MKWHKQKLVITTFILTALLILAQSSHANPNSQTHALDTSTYHFKLNNGSRLKFDKTLVSLGDANGLWTWVDNDEIKIYNLAVGVSECPSPWNIQISGPANVTVSTLFELDVFEATISAASGVTSTISFYCGSKGEPSIINVDGRHISFSYDESSAMVTFSIVHSSSHEVEVVWSKALTAFQSFLLMLYAVLPLVGLIAVVLIGGGVVLALKYARRGEME